MQLTILGSDAAYPRAGGASSGYLIEEGKGKLLVDCGTGVLSNLQRVAEIRDVTHIVISHLHADHFVDLIPYRYALFRPPHKSVAPRLYLPPNGERALLRAVSPFSGAPTFFSDFFVVREYDPDAKLKVGDFDIEFAPMRHYITAYGMAISGSKRLVYSSDSGPCEELDNLAQKADLFLCEATRCTASEDSEWGHLSAKEAAEVAKKAKVKRLVLTHFWPDCDYAQDLEQAKAVFGETVEMAKGLNTYTL